MRGAKLGRFYRPTEATMERFISDIEGIPLQSRRCGAHCRRTGEPCKNWGIRPTMRCRMHGGKGAGRPATSKRYTKARIAAVRKARCLLALLEVMHEKPKAV